MKVLEAKNSSLKVNKEIFSLNPASVINLFEIDVTDIAFEQGLITGDEDTNLAITSELIVGETEFNTTGEPVPSRSLMSSGIQGSSGIGGEDDEDDDGGNDDDDGGTNDGGNNGGPGPIIPPVTPPITVVKETSTQIVTLQKGTAEDLTVFRFHNSINLTRSDVFWRGRKYKAAAINADGFELNSKGTQPTPKLSIKIGEDSTGYLNIIKQHLLRLGNIVGAKVTRIRVLAKYIDEENFLGKIAPDGFDPDPTVELSRDIFYVDRKSNENKFGIELELGSLLDVEGVQLPSRIVSANRCLWSYRGHGCLYEFSSRKVDEVHGKNAILPTIAPPVANTNNEKFYDLLGTNVIDRGKWVKERNYAIGDSVYIEKNGLKYYFVAKVNNPVDPPPFLRSWLADQCSKSITGCKIRWKTIGLTTLPFGGYPGTNKAI